MQDARLLAAAGRVLEDAGWQGLTVEAVAEAAGLSRVTAWRLGASREALVATLLRELAVDYREAMWPALVGPGDARQRLDRALDALFGVVDAHLPLLLASDQVFHRAKAARINFNEPFTRLFEDGAADGSLVAPGEDRRRSGRSAVQHGLLVLCAPAGPPPLAGRARPPGAARPDRPGPEAGLRARVTAATQVRDHDMLLRGDVDPTGVRAASHLPAGDGSV